MKASIAAKLSQAYERMKPPAPEPLGVEKHYTLEEVARLWRVDIDTIRPLFAERPGVLRLGRDSRKRYTVMRIPESTVNRVHAEFSK